MNNDFQNWLGQNPWGAMGLVAILVAFGIVQSVRGKNKRRRLLEKIDSGAKILDVRSKSEFASGHYKDAINIPVDTISSKLKTLGNKETPLVVYCASGGRSSQAASVLRAAGFSDVTNAGGLSNMP